MLRRVTQKHAGDGAWGELVRRSSFSIWVTEAAKHTKPAVVRRRAMQELVCVTNWRSEEESELV